MPRCHECGGCDIRWHIVNGYSVGFCLHCGEWLFIKPSWMRRQYLMAEVRERHLDLEMGVVREQHQEDWNEVFKARNPDPDDLLNAIREMTHLIAIEGYGEDIQENFEQLLGMLEGGE